MSCRVYAIDTATDGICCGPAHTISSGDHSTNATSKPVSVAILLLLTNRLNSMPCWKSVSHRLQLAGCKHTAITDFKLHSLTSSCP